jgi:hypothetical protein
MHDDLVRFLEARANALRLAYAHATPPQHLLDAVLAREFALQRRLDGDIPECYGLLFAGPYDPGCHQCALQTVCLSRFSADTLKTAEHAVGQDPAIVGAHLDIDPKAISLAQTYAEHISGHAHTFNGWRKLPPPPRHKHDLSLYAMPRPHALAAFASILGARAALDVWRSEVSTLSEHGAAMPRVLGIRKAAYHRPAPRDARWKRRFKREQRRCSLYKHLRPGMILRKVYRNILHEVHVCDGYYRYEQQCFPTLYACVQAISGSLECPQSPQADGTRYTGVKKTALQSPLKFFRQAFLQLVHSLPPTAPKKAKSKA